MKFYFALTLFVVLVALSQVMAQNGDEEPDLNDGDVKPDLSEPRVMKSVKFDKVESKDGKPRIYDPCNYNPYDHSGCTSACWSVGYYYGGFCSGYDCYCYI